MMKKTTVLMLVFGLLALNSCKDQKEELINSGTLNEKALSSVSGKHSEGFTPPSRLHGKMRHNVRSFGAVGDGIHDDTNAFQAAIDSLPEDGGTVFVPPGTYLINGDVRDVKKKLVPGHAIRLRSKMHLEIHKNAILKAKPTDAQQCYVIYAYRVDDVQISGGKIIGERDQHLTTTGEFGHGIKLEGCNRVTINDMHISNFWGDGICIGAASAPGGVEITGNDMVIDNIISTGNRRQGLSIGAANNVQVWDSEFSNTEGTAPQCGIDIEPDLGSSTNNVIIENCSFFNNQGHGLNLWNRVSNVSIKYCQIQGNKHAGIFNNAPFKTYIAFNEIHNNTNSAVSINDGVDDMTVDQNIFYQNNRKPARDSTLQITGVSSETAKDVLIRPGAKKVKVGTNTYK